MKIYLAALWDQCRSLDPVKNDRRLFSYHFLKDIKVELLKQRLKEWHSSVKDMEDDNRNR